MSDVADRVELTVRVGRDRSLEVLAIGREGALPLVFHHGAPGGVAVYSPMVAAATGRDLRLVVYARPGYGGSSPAPGRTVADAAADVAAILDELGEHRFLTAGWSGGGPHALACARLLPGRCLAAASLSGVAPYGADGLDWLADMADENVSEFTAALAGEESLSGLLTATVPGLQEITGPKLAEGFGELASAADRAALQDAELADYVATMFRSGLRAGIAGWRDDDLAFVRDWGFSLHRPAGGAPVAVWQGDEDRMVPFAHGTWLATHVPAERVHYARGAGHMNLPLADVVDELLELAG